MNRAAFDFHPIESPMSTSTNQKFVQMHLQQ